MAQQETMPWEEYQSTPATGQGVVIPAAPEKPNLPSPTRETERWRVMTPEEVKANGLQEGQRYQINAAGKIETIAGKELTEGESKAVGFYQRMRAANTQIARLGLGPQDFATLIALRVAPNFSRQALSDEQRTQLDAIENWVAASLRLESGAAIAPSEFEKQARIFFPQPGAGPKEDQAKQQQRELSILGFKAMAGEQGARRADENLRALGFIDENGLPIIQGGAQGEQLAITGGERFSTEQDKAIASAVNSALASGADVQGLVQAATAAGANVTAEDVANFQAAVEARAKGQPVTFNTRQSGTRSPIAQAAGEALMTPAGTALTGAVNAAGLGLLSQFAGDQVQGLEALNPVSGMAGELVGSALGTAGLGRAAGGALNLAAPGLAARLAGGGTAGAVGRELAKDVAYGGIYAANTGEDVLTGAGLGATGSLGGQAVGAGIRRAAPVVGRMLGREVPPTDGGIPPVGPSGGVPPMGGGPSVPPTGGAPVAGMQAVDEPFAPVTFRSTDGGSMGTSLETQRYTQAEGLPVPIELTRGAATRDPEQLAFEKEQIFGALGGPLRNRAEENNLQALGNFERMVDLTGAQETTIATSGSPVIKALSEGYKNMKTKVNVAYKRAEKAPEAQEPVNYADLQAYIASQDEATKDIAPVLKSVAQQLAKNDPDGTGQITVATMENIRKLINRNAQAGTPSSIYAGDMKGIIDSLTEGKGGALYEQARKLRREQARKFESREVVARLVSNIKKLDDPKVAANQVFEKSILNENPSDIRFLRQTLRTLGPDGRQAWRELQGATIRHIGEQATKTTRMSADNNPIVSADGLKKAVDALDKDGRLDVIFSPKMAQQIRDLRDVVMYVNTVPPGTSINNSGTARTLVAMMGEMGLTGAASSYLTGTTVPVPIATGLRLMMQSIKNKEIQKKIARSLLPRGEQ